MARRETTVGQMLVELEELGQEVTGAWALVSSGPPTLVDLPVIWNGRMRSAAGRCTYAGDCAIQIDLNPRLRQEGPAAMRQTFLHELAHAIVPLDGHGAEWRSRMRMMGAEVRRKHSYETMTRRRQARRVVARCEKCGAEIRRRKALPRGTEFTHPRCGGGRIVPVSQILSRKG